MTVEEIIDFEKNIALTRCSKLKKLCKTVGLKVV